MTKRIQHSSNDILTASSLLANEAKNCTCPNRLDELSQSDDRNVRSLVAKNRKTSKETIERMMETEQTVAVIYWLHMNHHNKTIPGTRSKVFKFR